MTNVQYTPEMGAQMRASAASLDQEKTAGSFSMMANLAAAGISLALMAGIGVWGYQLMVRDVSGIPIVRAAEGDMRVRPKEPGGQLAQHQGLAVNTIAAEGEASGPVDLVKLAPAPVVLDAEDKPGQVEPLAEAGQTAPPEQATSAEQPAPVEQPAPLVLADETVEMVQQAEPPVEETPTMAQRIERGEIDQVVAELIAGVESTPAEPVIARQPGLVEPAADSAPTADTSSIVDADAPGPRESIRPRLRPSSALVPQTVAYTPPASRAEIDAAAIPPGTRLAQLGAFDSPDVARSEWVRLETRFGDVLANKSVVVQEVSSSGRVFYRLRAMGFRDLSDARRFCSAFQAEGVDCIPVVSR
ncbi:MAG: SPOR domain-containing protein [Pseudomonadota bacterium]